MKRLLIAIFLIVSCLAFGDTIVADSNSLADVQTAINSASPGDTVQIPAGGGSVTWGAGATYLSVNKAITVEGPGTGSLTITISDSAGTWTSATIRISAAATVKSSGVGGSLLTLFLLKVVF